MKRIIILALSCVCLSGCGSFVFGSGYSPNSAGNTNATASDSSATTSDSSSSSTTSPSSNDAVPTPEASTAASESSVSEGVVLDPSGGRWAFKVEKLASGYATRSMRYINASDQEVMARNNHGEPVEIFATTGFVNDLALVAQCVAMGSHGYCSDWNYGLMRKDGTFEMEMQSNYTMPSYQIFNTYPAVIGFVDVSGKRMTFPMWAGVVDIQAQGEAKTLFSNDRILVSNRSTHQMGYVNSRGMLMMNTQYLGASEFVNGKATVFDAKRGFGEIDTAGIYANASYACVSVHEDNPKYLRVNKGGECLNPLRDYRYSTYTTKLYFVPDFVQQNANPGEMTVNCIGGQTGIVLKSDMDKVIVPVEHQLTDVLYAPELDGFIVHSDENVMLYDSDGTEIFHSDSIKSVGTICGYDLYIVKDKQGLMGAIKGDGTEFLPTEYSELAFDTGSKRLAALKKDNISMHEISALALPADKVNKACGTGLKLVSVYMQNQVDKLKAAQEKAQKAKDDWNIQKEADKKAKAQAQAIQLRAASKTTQFRNRIDQEIQENQNAAKLAQEKAAELEALNQRQQEIMAEINTINGDNQYKFTLEGQNKLRTLKTELTEVETRLNTLNETQN